jgi:hypothetical protein
MSAVASGTVRRARPLAGARGARLAGAAFLPVGGLDPWVGAGALAAVLATAACLYLRRGTDAALRADLVRWLGIAGAGALVAAAS